ncbi:MAG: hypothetical protein JXR07_19240 [Reichenbachiella sp.]
MIKKSDQTLLEIIHNRHRYQAQAVITAFKIIEHRGLLSNGSLSENEKEQLIKIKNELITSRAKPNEYEKIDIKKSMKSITFNWLPKAHVVDLIGYYAFCSIVTIILWFPFHDMGSDLSWYLMGLFIIIPLWQGNILADSKKAKRQIHLHERSIFSLAMTVIYLLRYYVIYNELSMGRLVGGIVIYLVAFVGIGIISIFLYHIQAARLKNPTYYFLRKFRWVTPVAFVFILTLVFFEEGWFVTNRKIIWDENKPMTDDDFEGYTNLFTHYDGAISTYLDYEFDDHENLVKLNAVCNSAHSWINRWDKGSYFLLQHERYHFNLTEVVTRMARKAILDTLKQGADKEGVMTIINRHHQIRNELQNNYDTETDHSILQDMQGYWQFKIDSMLLDLDPYWTSEILLPQLANDTIQYFRYAKMDGRHSIVGCYPLLNGEEKYTRHYRFYKNSEGRVDSISHHQYGEPSVEGIYDVYSLSIKQNSDTETTWKFYDQSGKLTMNKYNYAVLVETKIGNTASYFYFDKDKRKRLNYGNVFATYVRSDSLNRQIEKWFVDKKGNRIKNKSGHSFIRYGYDKMNGYEGRTNFASKVSYFDLLGGLPQSVNGVASKIYGRNKYGLNQLIAKTNLDGQYVFTDDFAIELRSFDELGNTKTFHRFDADSVLYEGDEGYSTYTWSSDRYGNTNRYSMFNANKVLVANENGIASGYYKYDSAGNKTMYAMYGTGDELIFDEGYGKIKRSFDSLGRIVKVTNYNGYDYPISSDFFPAVYCIERDSSGLELNYFYYSKDMDKDTSSNGAHHRRYIYDQSDNIVESYSYDLNDELVAVEKDVSIFRYLYDNRNNKIESRFYTTNNQLAFANQGIAINKYVYSENDKMVERSYFDTLGRLAPFDGHSLIKYFYDQNGNEIETRYYDEYQNLIDTGIAIIKNEFDNRGNNISIKKYDHMGRFITSDPPIISIKYNLFNEIIVESYFNSLGTPSLDSDSVHSYRYFQDEKNQYMGKSFHDVNGGLTLLNGYALYKIIRDSRGNIIKESHYNEWEEPCGDEEGIFSYEYEYDLFDRVIEKRFYDVDGLPFLYDSLFSKIKFKRNDAGQILEKTFYDSNSELAYDSDSIALYKYYHNRNNVSTTKKYDHENALKILNSNDE